MNLVEYTPENSGARDNFEAKAAIAGLYYSLKAGCSYENEFYAAKMW